MTPFWRKESLSDAEQRLFRATLHAHDLSARRNNVSTHAVATGATAADDFGKAIAGAILTLGGLHGPIERAMVLLSLPEPVTAVEVILAKGRKVPGWGNSFHRGEPDPRWGEVAELLSGFPSGRVVRGITDFLHAQRLLLFPNPAAYTAATCLALGLPRCVAPYLFILGRLSAWTEIYLQTHQELWD